MILKHRLMQPADLPECVELIASHPVIGPRYGKAIDDLGHAWLRLLGRTAKTAVVIENLEQSRKRACFVGFTIFVGDAFIEELKAGPMFWIGPELARRAVRGECPILTDRQLREANARGELNLVTWAGCIRSGFESCTALYQEIMRSFILHHRGYQWEELIANQMESPDRLRWTLRTGGSLWNPQERRYVEESAEDLEQIVNVPHLVGITRSVELARPASWVGTFFSYQPPRCAFRRSEQQLLLAALDGRTDAELADELGVSIATVKKTWLAVYRRVALRLPGVLPSGAPNGEASESRRGREKRRRLLAYLRDHPEELRPVSQRLLDRR
jgi:hypothetical protein